MGYVRKNFLDSNRLLLAGALAPGVGRVAISAVATVVGVAAECPVVTAVCAAVSAVAADDAGDDSSAARSIRSDRARRVAKLFVGFRFCLMAGESGDFGVEISESADAVVDPLITIGAVTVPCAWVVAAMVGAFGAEA